MKTKPITPYQRLLSEIRKYCFEVKHPHTVTMWHYPKAKLGEGWSLTDLYERTKAAEQLGYSVQLQALDIGLSVRYVKNPPSGNYDW